MNADQASGAIGPIDRSIEWARDDVFLARQALERAEGRLALLLRSREDTVRAYHAYRAMVAGRRNNRVRSR